MSARPVIYIPNSPFILREPGVDCDEGRESRMCPTVKEEEFTTDVSLNSEGTGPTVGERRVCEAPPLGSLRVCDQKRSFYYFQISNFDLGRNCC